MLVKNVYRGTMVTFTTAFYDATNTLVVPSNPTVTLYYKSNNQYVTVPLNLTGSGNAYSASWDSSNADVGIVQWHISGGANTGITTDGEFRIYSNKANGGPGAT